MEHVGVEDVNRVIQPAAVMRPLTESVGTTDLAINYYELEPGDSFAYAYHVHEIQEDLFYVQSGTVTFETEAGSVLVAAGEVIRFPPGKYRRGTNEGDERVIALALGAPLEYSDQEKLRECDTCGERTPQRIESAAGGEARITVCDDCGTEAGRWTLQPSPDPRFRISVGESTDGRSLASVGAFAELAARIPGEFVDEVVRPRALEVGEFVASGTVGVEFLGGEVVGTDPVVSVGADDERDDLVPPLFVLFADDCDVLDSGVCVEDVLGADRRRNRSHLGHPVGGTDVLAELVDEFFEQRSGHRRGAVREPFETGAVERSRLALVEHCAPGPRGEAHLRDAFLVDDLKSAFGAEVVQYDALRPEVQPGATTHS